MAAMKGCLCSREFVMFLFYVCTEWYVIYTNIYIHVHIYTYRLTVFLITDDTLNSMKYHKNNLFSFVLMHNNRDCLLFYHSICSFLILCSAGNGYKVPVPSHAELFYPILISGHVHKCQKGRGGVGVTTWNGIAVLLRTHDAILLNFTSRLSDHGRGISCERKLGMNKQTGFHTTLN